MIKLKARSMQYLNFWLEKINEILIILFLVNIPNFTWFKYEPVHSVAHKESLQNKCHYKKDYKK